MRQVSAFIIALAKTVSDDLREHVAPDQLRGCVEEEVEQQILAQCVQAIGEYNSAVKFYKGDPVKAKVARRKVLRFMGYCSEMWTAIDVVKGAISATSSSLDVEDEVFSA